MLIACGSAAGDDFAMHVTRAVPAISNASDLD
jgi:hypothetical protein